MIQEIPTTIKKVDKIFHIGDIHIRNYHRHKEYMEVFERTRDYIVANKTDNSIIYVAGDLVHSKLDMSPELIGMVAKFLKIFADVAPTILILGNHDKLKNLSRKDAVSPIVDILDYPNLYFLNVNGYYKFAQIGFNLMEVFTAPSQYLSGSKLNSELRVALYHGMVDESTTDAGFKMENRKIQSDLFDGHHLALLGDIHSRQVLQEHHIEELEVDEEELETYIESGWEVVEESYI